MKYGTNIETSPAGSLRVRGVFAEIRNWFVMRNCLKHATGEAPVNILNIDVRRI